MGGNENIKIILLIISGNEKNANFHQPISLPGANSKKWAYAAHFR
jgi:hypothetical protein